MASTRRAYAGGAQSTTTSSAIASSGTTSFTITAYTGWPYGSDPFFIVVQPGTASEEKILVTRTGSTDTTINIASDSERAQDGTSAVGHSSGSVVFPVFTALDADEANELTSSWSTKGDLVSYGSSTFETLGVGSNGALLMADSGETSGLKWAQPGYTYVQTVYFTSSGTFTKASYPWLRAIRVKCQAGGGGGGGTPTQGATNATAGGGGSGGNYAESFITDISSLASSVTVTRGAGGAGGDGTVNGANGGDSEFGAGTAYEVKATGGAGTGRSSQTGYNVAAAGIAPGGSVGDVIFIGSDGGAGFAFSAEDVSMGGHGGHAHLGGGGRSQGSNTQAVGRPGSDYGGGGGGAFGTNSSAQQDGGNGADGIVIVELYA